MSRPSSEPPDWALPSWDAIPAEPAEPVARRSAEPVARPARSLDPAPGFTGTGPPVAGAPGTFGLRILGVSEVTRAIRGAVRADPRLTDLWVEGEIGRVTVSSAGHAYFALKDERNQLQCVWFRDDRLRSATMHSGQPDFHYLLSRRRQIRCDKSKSPRRFRGLPQ